MLARTRIRNNVKLAEAPSFGHTIFEHAPDSNGARDYEAFTAEFLTMIGMAPRDANAATPAAPTNAAEPPAPAAESPPATGEAASG
jgi:chromosome partitioning protein